jgi:hypothetical protein
LVELWQVALGLSFTGLCTGIGVAVGGAIVELWLKPYIKKLHSAHKKINTEINYCQENQDAEGQAKFTLKLTHLFLGGGTHHSFLSLHQGFIFNLCVISTTYNALFFMRAQRDISNSTYFSNPTSKYSPS